MLIRLVSLFSILIYANAVFAIKCHPQKSNSELISYISCNKSSSDCKKIKKGLKVNSKTKVYLEVEQAKLITTESTSSHVMESDYIKLKLSKNSACWLNSKMNEESVGKMLNIFLRDEVISSAIITSPGEEGNLIFSLSLKPETKSLELCRKIDKSCKEIESKKI